MPSNLGAKRWASTNNLHEVLPDRSRWRRLEKYNEKFTKTMDKFHESASYIKKRLEHPVILIWSDDFNEILDSCFSKVHELAFGDFLRAVNGKMMNKVNDQMAEIFNIAITIQQFIGDAVQEPKKPRCYKRNVRFN